MRSAAETHHVEGSPTLASASFGIGMDQAHIMMILRDTLYTRKALAVLREYASNARDEHCQCGKGEVPIKVTLPTFMKPVLKVQDFGRGLSENDVLNVYTQYGDSTKRDTNVAVGMLGIGCKAGFCYTDSFTVTSCFEGTKSVYMAVMDPSGKGRMDLIHTDACGEDTGIEISLAIRPQDVQEFRREAEDLFRYFQPQPEINMELEEVKLDFPEGTIHHGGWHGEWVALMGCIPYKMDTLQLKDRLEEEGLWDTLRRVHGIVSLPIGSVQFSASREELQYTEKTVNTMVARLGDLLKVYTDNALAAMSKPDVSGWDRRVKALFFKEVLGLPLPDSHKKWGSDLVTLFTQKDPPKTFTLHISPKSNPSTQVAITTNSYIVIYDQPEKGLKKWSLNNSRDTLIVPKEGVAMADVEAELQTLLKKAGLDGMPVGKLSEKGYFDTTSSARKKNLPAPNAKHRARTFTLEDPFYDSVPRSGQWTLAEPPTEDHIFVIISGFVPKGSSLAQMKRDRVFLREWGVSWPIIYGYKSTDTKPVKASDIEKGKPYEEWLQEQYQKILTPEACKEIQMLFWSELHSKRDWRHSSDGAKTSMVLVTDLSNALGRDHQVVDFFARILSANASTKKWSSSKRDKMTKLARRTGQKKDHREALDAIWKAYPMLSLAASNVFDLIHVCSSRSPEIMSYIKMVDLATQGSKDNPEA